MPPKKKTNKKANDDWEADLGESIALTSAETAPAGATNGDDDDDSAGGGGLMALMRKKKEKRKKQGLSEDFVQGEDAPDAETQQVTEHEVKVAEEASLDDEFAQLDKKGKSGKGKPHQKTTPEPSSKDEGQARAEDGGDDELGEGGRVLTKAEKEKLKKERERQRKKEQVCP